MSGLTYTSRTMAHDTPQDAGLLLVVSGPSGVGKTTIVRALLDRLNAVFSVSATTRPKADGEVEGRDYYFMNEQQFQSHVDRGEFLEYAQVFGKHWYGTPRNSIQEHLDNGRVVVLDIDVQGGLQVKQRMPDSLMVFINPPSDEELLRRLRKRAREDEAVIQRRFAEAKHEMNMALESGAYDRIIINDDLQRAIDEICALVVDHRASMRQ